MAIKVRIPTPLRKYTANQAEVSASGGTIKAIIDDLDRNHPGLKDRICDENGKLRKFVNIFLNDEDVRFMESIDTPVKDGDEVGIVPAIAGGSGTLQAA
ncbi:MAG: MoaD/ThiS family protein [Deltaproteobacteria bacterium]|nr:MoaD/ThiS family protein [Deltaproteobacteria bacterium]